MFARLVVLFVAVPLVELYLLFRLNDWTGSPIATIGLILFTGFLGAWLARQQGLSTLRRIQTAASEGRMPGAELLDGGMILVAGALLLTPGILTDAFGFSLLFPPCRVVYRKLLKRSFSASSVNFHVGGPNSTRDPGENDPTVVDGTASRSDDED
jgi:UPF0716 protein FxsA